MFGHRIPRALPWAVAGVHTLVCNGDKLKLELLLLVADEFTFVCSEEDTGDQNESGAGEEQAAAYLWFKDAAEPGGDRFGRRCIFDLF